MRRLCLLLAALLLWPGAAPATPDRASGNAASPDEKFQNMDKNGDEKLSPEEFFAAYPNMHEAAFTSLDKDGDNFISLEEWRSFSNAHGQGMGASPQGMGGGPVMRETPRENGSSGTSEGAPGGRKPLFDLKPKDEAQ